MLLVLDVGNTNTVLELFDGDRLVGNWRVSSYDRTSDETALMLQGLLLYGGIPKNAVEGAILSSVVPRLEEVWCGAVKNCFGITPYIVTPAMDFSLESSSFTTKPASWRAGRNVLRSPSVMPDRKRHV